MKKKLKYIFIALVIFGLCFTKGNLIELIDMTVVTPIANVLYVIYDVIGDFGLAIILFTALVKLCMWPLSKSQLQQTNLMKKIQPELAQIRKNCNGNKQLESLQTMDLYKKYNVKPLRSLLTTLIQLPIFIGLYSAIRVMVLPTVNDNLDLKAYSFVKYEDSNISEVISLQKPYLESKADENIPAEEKEKYDFHPKLFGFVALDGTANNILRGDVSLAVLFALFCCIVSAFSQYWVTKQQQPSGKTKSKKFRDLMKEAENGKEPDSTDLAAITTGSMTKTMPIMMFLIMFNLPGALVFYYLLSNIFSIAQQKIIFKKINQEMDDMTDKTILKELKNIQEAKIIENKKTGTKITRISTKDNKKKRR